MEITRGIWLAVAGVWLLNLAEVSAEALPRYSWSDGRHQQEAILAPQFKAFIQVDPSEGSQEKASPRALEGFQLTANHGKILIYRQISTPTSKAGVPLLPGYEASEVFLKRAGDPKSLMVPTGEILVDLEASMGDEDVAKWARAQQLQVVRALNLRGRNGWVLKGPPGLRAITLATRLREERAVKMAVPNWWRPYTLR